MIPAISQPLDPLTQDEYIQTVALLRAAGHVNDSSRFSSLELLDPEKTIVQAWQPGDDFGRAAFAVVKQGLQTFEATVDLSNASVKSWTEIAGVQPSLLLEEIMAVRGILADNNQFVAALAAHGFSIEDVICAPLTVGNCNIPEHRGRRLIKSTCSLIGDVSIFNRPIEGLGAVVDLNTHEVVEIIDQGEIPVSEAPATTDEASLKSDRAPLKPVVLHQPNGSNFTIQGNVLEWDNWKLHYRLEKRSGLVVSTVSYRDRGKMRPIQSAFSSATSETLRGGILTILRVPDSKDDAPWSWCSGWVPLLVTTTTSSTGCLHKTEESDQESVRPDMMDSRVYARRR